MAVIDPNPLDNTLNTVPICSNIQYGISAGIGVFRVMPQLAIQMDLYGSIVHVSRRRALSARRE